MLFKVLSRHMTILTHCFLHATKNWFYFVVINRKIPLSIMWMCHTARLKVFKHTYYRIN